MKISDNIMKDNKETVYTPYTYLIGWSKLNKWYYGVRYATKTKCLYESGCHPDDLWKTYHTSSEIVTAFRKEHGEPDFIEIRKTFSNSEDALDWEKEVLKRMNVLEENRWINSTDISGPPVRCGKDHPKYIHGLSGDPDWQREMRKEYYQNRDVEKRSKYNQEYYKKNRETIRKSSAKYYENNIEKSREWYKDNSEKVREKSRKYRENNREKERERQRQYRAKNKLEKSLQTA